MRLQAAEAFDAHARLLRAVGSDSETEGEQADAGVPTEPEPTVEPQGLELSESVYDASGVPVFQEECASSGALDEAAALFVQFRKHQ